MFRGGEVWYIILLKTLFFVIRHVKIVLDSVERDLLLKKGDRENPGHYRGITLLSVVLVGKLFYKNFNTRLVECLDKEFKIHQYVLVNDS